MKIISKRYFTSLKTTIQKPYNVLFFGSDEYSRMTLNSLLNHSNYPKVVKRLIVVTPGVIASNTPGDYFDKYLTNKKIEKFVFQKYVYPIEDYVKTQKQPFDIGVVASFSKIIPDEILDFIPKGVIVAHPSLLPNYRGGSPIEHCILNNEKKTGITMLEASKGKRLTGKILTQSYCDIDPKDDYIHLANKCGKISGKLIVEILSNVDEYLSKAVVEKISETDISALTINKEDAIFLWDKLTVKDAVRKQRAFFGSPMSGFTKFKLKSKWTYAFFDKLIAETNTTTKIYKEILEPVERDRKRVV